MGYYMGDFYARGGRARFMGDPGFFSFLGKIGKAAFRHIVNDARFKNHPACLETPKRKDLREDIENLATLRSLVESG